MYPYTQFKKMTCRDGMWTGTEEGISMTDMSSDGNPPPPPPPPPSPSPPLPSPFLLATGSCLAETAVPRGRRSSLRWSASASTPRSKRPC